MQKTITDDDCIQSVINRIRGNPDLLPDLIETTGKGVLGELADPDNWVMTEKSGFFTCTRTFACVAPSVPADRITATVIVKDRAISETVVADSVAIAKKEQAQAQAAQQAQQASQQQAPTQVPITNMGQMLSQMAGGQMPGGGVATAPAPQAPGQPNIQMQQLLASLLTAAQGVPAQAAPAPAQPAGPPMMPVPTAQTVSAAGFSVIAQAVGATQSQFPGWAYAPAKDPSSGEAGFMINLTSNTAGGRLTPLPYDLVRIVRTQGLYPTANQILARDHRIDEATGEAILTALGLTRDDRIATLVP